MPTYNHAAFIGEAIQSVLDQTYGDFELIVVDNYSQDDTEDIVRGFDDSRIEYFKFSNNGVIAASRNAALKKARGEFIAFLDSDDTWSADKIETQLKHLEANPSVAMVCSSLVTRRGNEPFDTASGPATAGLAGFTYSWLLDRSFIFCSSVMVRREVLDSVGMFDEDPRMVSSEDWDLWLRIARRHRLTLLGKALGSYRVHGSNVSAGVRKIRPIEYVLHKHLAKRWITAARLDRSMAYFSFGLGWLSIDQAPVDARGMFKDTLKFARGSPKISSLALSGLVLSFFPTVCRFIKHGSVDRLIKRMVSLHEFADDSEE
jgi:glycosyltransferase involved in cell wall biosynthesis